MGGRLQPAYIAWYALAFAALYALTFALALRHRPRRYQLFASLMLVGWGWATTKEGFVNGNHFPEYFRILVAAIALVCICVPPRSLYAGALALAACITLATTSVPSIDPVRSLHALGTEVADLAQPGRFAQLSASTRAGLLRSEKLAPSALALVKGHSFAIEPWEDMIAWADPEARWDPEPVVQSYSAYTAYLDQLDAAFLASSHAPQRMLVWRFPFGFDFRDPFADPPKTMETIYCRYVQVALSGAWQVLQRAPDRCGRAVRIGEVHARFGQSVTVPSAPGKMVLATFLFGPTLLAKLETVLLKQPDTFLTTWAGRDRPVTYRLVPGTSADEHVIAAPATLGYAPRFTPQTVERLQVSGAGWTTGTGSVTIVFSAVSMSR